MPQYPKYRILSTVVCKESSAIRLFLPIDASDGMNLETVTSTQSAVDPFNTGTQVVETLPPTTGLFNSPKRTTMVGIKKPTRSQVGFSSSTYICDESRLLSILGASQKTSPLAPAP